MVKTIYLAGPVTGTSFVQAHDWRHVARRHLAAFFRVLSPLRGQEKALEGIGRISSTYPDHPLMTAKALITRCRRDVEEADLIIANFSGVQRVSIGTMIELGWADTRRVPLVTVFPKLGTGGPGVFPNPNDHPFVREMSGWVVETVEEACNIAEAVLGP